MQRFAQAADMRVDSALIDKHAMAPNRIQKLRTRKYPCWGFHQEPKQPKLGGCKMYHAAIALDTAGLTIKFNIATMYDGRNLFRFYTAQTRMNTGNQFGNRYRFDNDVVRTR